MSRTEVVTITNMCMVYDGSKVLVQDKIDDEYSGLQFPGGHVEKGESFPVLCGIKDWSNDDGSRYMVLFYKTDKFEGELTSSCEGEVHWVELEDMKKRKLAKGMDKMLEVFLNEEISEYFFYKENGEWLDVLK